MKLYVFGIFALKESTVEVRRDRNGCGYGQNKINCKWMC